MKILKFVFIVLFSVAVFIMAKKLAEPLFGIALASTAYYIYLFGVGAVIGLAARWLFK